MSEPGLITKKEFSDKTYWLSGYPKGKRTDYVITTTTNKQLDEDGDFSPFLLESFTTSKAALERFLALDQL